MKWKWPPFGSGNPSTPWYTKEKAMSMQSLKHANARFGVDFGVNPSSIRVPYKNPLLLLLEQLWSLDWVSGRVLLLRLTSNENAHYNIILCDRGVCTCVCQVDACRIIAWFWRGACTGSVLGVGCLWRVYSNRRKYTRKWSRWRCRKGHTEWTLLHMPQIRCSRQPNSKVALRGKSPCPQWARWIIDSQNTIPE